MKKKLSLLVGILTTIVVNAQTWNFSAWENKTFSETTTINGLTIAATSDYTVSIDENEKVVDGITYIKRLKLGGSSNSEARYLSFSVSGACTIEVVAQSSSTSADRELSIAKGSFDNVVKSIPASGTVPEKSTFEYEGEASTIYIYSPKGGVNIYSISVDRPVTIWDFSANAINYVNDWTAIKADAEKWGQVKAGQDVRYQYIKNSIDTMEVNAGENKVKFLEGIYWAVAAPKKLIVGDGSNSTYTNIQLQTGIRFFLKGIYAGDTIVFTACNTGKNPRENCVKFYHGNPTIIGLSKAGEYTAQNIIALNSGDFEVEIIADTRLQKLEIRPARSDSAEPTQVNPALTIAKNELEIITGGTTAIEYTSKNGITPTFTSSDETIAKVDATGMITAVAPGMAIITVTSTANLYYETVTAEVLVTVKSNGTEVSVDESNVLNIYSKEAIKGGTIIFPIELTNEKAITAFQFELAVPNGVTVEGAELTSRKSNQTLNYSKLANGSYQFVSFSGDSRAFSGIDGELVRVQLKTGEAVVAGDYTIEVRNIELTTTDGKACNPADCSAVLTIINALQGDANNDGELNVADIVEMVNYILGRPSAKFVRAFADLNDDGDVSVTDIVLVVNIIMSAQNASARSLGSIVATPTDGDQLTLTETDGQLLALNLENQGKYVASQFDVRLSEGQTLEGIKLNSRRLGNHRLTYTQTGSNLYRVIVYSLNNEAFEGDRGELLGIEVTGSGSVGIENALFVTTGQKEKRFAPINGNATMGIDSLPLASGDSQDIYDLQGRRVENGSEKGVYIIKGKKHIVK